MADTKLTGLNETTSIVDADLLYAVINVATTAASRKVTVANFRKGLLTAFSFDSYSTATHTQDATKSCCVCTATVDSVLTLAASTGTGNVYHYSNIGTGIITLTPTSGTIQGEATQILNPNESIDLIDYAADQWIW